MPTTSKTSKKHRINFSELTEEYNIKDTVEDPAYDQETSFIAPVININKSKMPMSEDLKRAIQDIINPEFKKISLEIKQQLDPLEIDSGPLP